MTRAIRNDDHFGHDDHDRLGAELNYMPAEQEIAVHDFTARHGAVPLALPAPEGLEVGRIEAVPAIPEIISDAEAQLLLHPQSPLLGRSSEPASGPRFDYGYTSVKDIRVDTQPDPKNKGARIATTVYINDEPLKPSARFWGSLMANFGFAPSTFKYFDHAEVFGRIAERASNDRLRYTIVRDGLREPQALAVVQPNKATISYDDLVGTLGRYAGERVTYADGMVNSTHTPRVGGNQFMVGPDAMINKFLMEVPVDGYGKPSIYLAMERIVCANGAVARTPMFKTELNIGKGADVVKFAVERALDSFNNDEGFAALREKMETAGKSWASVFEATTLYKRLVRLISGRHILGTTADQADQEGKGSSVLTAFHQLTGDVSMIYGLANLDALAAKKQRTLPVNAKVLDLINFATEIGTHRATEYGRQQLHAWVGTLVGDRDGYDLEGTVDKWQEFRDFWANTDRDGLKATRSVDS